MNTGRYLLITPTESTEYTKYHLLSSARGISGRRGDSDRGKKKSRHVPQRGIERGEGTLRGSFLRVMTKTNDVDQVNLAEPPLENDIDLWNSYGSPYVRMNHLVRF